MSMSDDPQAQHSDLVPVRYVGAEGLIVNGQGVVPGDIVSLPAEEVAQWPDPHPYYARADQAPDVADAAAPERTSAPSASPASEEAAAVPAPAP